MNKIEKGIMLGHIQKLYEFSNELYLKAEDLKDAYLAIANPYTEGAIVRIPSHAHERHECAPGQTVTIRGTYVSGPPAECKIQVNATNERGGHVWWDEDFKDVGETS